VTNELLQLTGKEDVVTIFAGGNDTNAIVNAAVGQLAARATQAAVQQFLATEIQAFGNDFTSLYASIHAKAPSAEIVIANLPNFAGIPISQMPSVASAKPMLQAVSVGIDTNVYAAAARAGIRVADVLCDPRSYPNADFYPGPLADGFHPNDVGYAALASTLLAQINAPTPTTGKLCADVACRRRVRAARPRHPELRAPLRRGNGPVAP